MNTDQKDPWAIVIELDPLIRAAVSCTIKNAQRLVAQRLGKDPCDVLAEARIKAAYAISNYRPGRAALSVFVYTSVRHFCLDLIKLSNKAGRTRVWNLPAIRKSETENFAQAQDYETDVEAPSCYSPDFIVEEQELIESLEKCKGREHDLVLYLMGVGPLPKMSERTEYRCRANIRRRVDPSSVAVHTNLKYRKRRRTQK